MPSPEQSAWKLLERLQRKRPTGAPPIRRNTRNKLTIATALREGLSVDDAELLVDGAAELIESGEQCARWWYPENLFTGTTSDRWLGHIYERRHGRDLTGRRQGAEEAAHQQRVAESMNAASESVQSLAVARWAAPARAALAARSPQNSAEEKESGS